jgi:DNA-binding transcriptional MocR family regulator
MGQFIGTANPLNEWDQGKGRKFERLATAIERALVNGDLSNPLPPERTLAAQLGVSRGTVTAAYGVLKDRRLIASRSGGYTRSDTLQVKRHARAARLAALAIEDGAIVDSYIERDPAGMDLAFAILGVPERLRFIVEEAHLAALTETASTQYMPAGRLDLKIRIAELFREQNVPTRPEQIIITQGAYQGISLATQLALQPGDRVACEYPTYPGALEIFHAHSANVAEIASYDSPDSLKELEFGAAVDLIYASSTYQNPTGLVIQRASAARLARIAEERAIVTIDDRALEHCGYAVEAHPPLATYRPAAPILTLGSLDKTTGAGTRIGWIRAPLSLVSKLTRLKALSDFASPNVTQSIALHLLEHLSQFSAERRRELLERYDSCAAALAMHLPTWRWAAPIGGSSLWVDTGTDADEVVSAARRAGITLLAGRTFSMAGHHRTHVRIALARPPEALAALIKRLAASIRTS